MGKNLRAKASLVTGPRAAPEQAASKQPVSHSIPDEAAHKPKTAIGAMAQFTDRQSSAIKEVEVLKDRLREFDGCFPTKHIDPKLIVRSKWANRHELSFKDEDFKGLKNDIELEGGNVQPIKVRPLHGETGRYEIVYGHRRHQACLDLGIQVLAIIENVDEKKLFIEMDRENRQRKDLRPYEVGAMYARALDEGLFSSLRKMAEEVAIDQSQLGKAISLARLPSDVVKAFVSPLDLQYRWASDLVAAIQENPDVVLSVAKAIQVEEPRPASTLVFSRLVEKRGTVPQLKDRSIPLQGKSGQKGQLVFNEKKRSVDISLSNINPARYAEIQSIIKQFLSV
jgi:ParB family chromosome partitioning protein